MLLSFFYHVGHKVPQMVNLFPLIVAGIPETTGRAPVDVREGGLAAREYPGHKAGPDPMDAEERERDWACSGCFPKFEGLSSRYHK